MVRGANQAIAAAREGARVGFIGCVGAETHGGAACEALGGLGIDLSRLKNRTGDHRPCRGMDRIDSEGRNQIAVASGANEALRADALIAQTIAPNAFVVLQMGPAPGRLRLRSAMPNKARSILNLAPARPLLGAMLAQADVLGARGTF